MTTLEPAAGVLSGRSAARILAVTVALAAAVTLLPTLAAALVPDRSAVVAPGTAVTVPLPRTPAFRVTAPAGWTPVSVPRSPDRPWTWTRDAGSISVYAWPAVPDADAYAGRLVRLTAARGDLVAVPDGRASGPDGLTGPHFRVTDPDGRTGELVVLGRGRDAVGLLSLSTPDRPVDLRPLVDSLRVAS